MHITTWYSNNFERLLKGRYITLEDIQPILSTYAVTFKISIAGTSEMGKEIPLVHFGTGEKKVLIWSQMHGNESTTTKALFDFFKFITLNTKISEALLASHSFYVLPMLNPDGAALYTRENARNVDLNRDAQYLSQSESRLLRNLFDEIQPDLCLNMHDQRTIYGLSSGFSATVSFLAPSGDIARTITPARKEAMSLIEKMHAYISTFCPNQIGRYDDSFNLNCVGDTFTSLGVPTILFEAGHYQDDYEREQTRAFIFYALVALFDLDKTTSNTQDYLTIPENQKNYHDIVLYNVKISEVESLQTLCFQYKEVLLNRSIVFELYLVSIQESTAKFGHKAYDIQGGTILLNSQRNFDIGQKVTTIFDEQQNIMLI